MNLDVQKIVYNLLIRSEIPGRSMCDGHGIDPITDTGYGGFTCSMS